MKQMKFELTGITPLIMQSDTLVDPINELTRAIVKLEGRGAGLPAERPTRSAG